MEKRFLQQRFAQFQKGGKRTIKGYAARYGVLSSPLPTGTAPRFVNASRLARSSASSPRTPTSLPVQS